MPGQKTPHLVPSTDGERFKVCHRPTSTHDRVGLAAVLHAIEDLREAAGGVGGGNIGHRIRLSD